MAVHVVYKYQMRTQRGPTGWSETFWNGASSLGEASVPAAKLATILQAVHGNRALMQGYSLREVSDDPAVKNPRRVSYFAINESEAQAESRLAGMYPTTALRLQIFDTDAKSNYVYLKGMPDGIDSNGDLTFPLTWIPRANFLKSHLQDPANGWCRRTLSDLNVPAALTAGTTGGVFTVANGHFFAVNDRVRIGRTISKPNIDGVYRVIATGGVTNFTIVGMPIIDVPPEINENSYARKVSFTTRQIVECRLNAVTKKNVGRPFGSPSGRQKTPKN